MVPYLKKRMTHKLGWMALLPSRETYNWYFDDMDHLTNITYQSKFYGFQVHLTYIKITLKEINQATGLTLSR